MAAYGAVAPDLEVGKSQLSLDLPVALLHPLPQAVDPEHFTEIRLLKRGFFCLAVARGGQVGHQVPRAVGWQRLWVRAHRHQAHGLLGEYPTRMVTSTA